MKETAYQKNILLSKIKDGLSREQTLDGITDLGNYLFDIKRRLRTTWFGAEISYAVSSSIER